MYEPDEPHDQWGKPIVEPTSWLQKTRDIVFFSCVGTIFVITVIVFYVIFLPYYLGREIWQRFENWYINK